MRGRVGAPGRRLPSSRAACTYFDLEFEDRAGTARWQDIPTPALQAILDYQEFEPAVCEVAYVMIGRTLYEVGERDGWQVIPFFKGQAASGKSTIVLKVCAEFFDRCDVGILSNNIEKKFGLSAFHDKLLFVGPEVKRDLALEQAEFQSMVSGEDVQVNIKHVRAKAVQWRVPGALAGNEVPNWCDNASSIVRRIVLFQFDRSVVQQDSQLGAKLHAEMPSILQKCNRAYLDWARRFGGQNLWNHLPAYFKRQQDSLRQATNSLEAFLSSGKLRFGAELYMPLALFNRMYTERCRQAGLTKRSLTRQVRDGTFPRYAVRYIETVVAKPYGPHSDHFPAQWVYGVDMSKHWPPRIEVAAPAAPILRQFVGEEFV